MAAMDDAMYADCKDNVVPLWSGDMLKQLKALINTPGKTWEELRAKDEWPVYIFDYEGQVKGEKVSLHGAQTIMKMMGGKANGWKKYKAPRSADRASQVPKTPEKMTKSELLELVLKLKEKLAVYEPDDEDEDEEDAPFVADTTEEIKTEL